MLQIDNSHLVSVSEANASPTTSLWEAIDYALGFLRRRYLIIVTCLVLAVASAAAYLVLTPKSYVASSVMMIDARRGQMFGPSIAGEVLPDAAWIDSQIGILKSENVAAYVVKQLRLSDDPEFVRPDLGILGKIRTSISSRLGQDVSDLRSEAERFAQSVGILRSQIDAKRIGGSYLIRIEVSSNNPEQAAKVANAVIDAYIFDQLNAKYQANRRAGDWLQERLQTLREQTSAAERAVLEFKAKNNMVAVDGKLMNDKQLADLSNQLGAARVRSSDVQARLGRIEAIIHGDQVDVTSEATVSDTLNNSIITRLRSQYLDLVNREADWSARFGKNHNAVINIRNQMRDIRNSMLGELKRIAETYKSEYAISKSLQEELEKRLATLLSQSQETNQAQITLHTLEATAQSYRKLYDNFLQRHVESIQQQSYPSSEARLISPASLSRSYPVTSHVWILAVMAGCAIGFGLGGLRELMDRVFRTSSQVRSILEAECLAMVPLLKDDDEQRALSPRRIVADPGARKINTETRILRAVVETPFSHYTESIRSIKLSADRSHRARPTKVIGVISSVPGEGKSTAAVALAQVARHGGARVLLLDCDLRNPSLSRTLTPHAKVGFVDVVFGDVALEAAIFSDPITKLDFLPSVDNRWVPYSAEFLASEATKDFFERLQSRYDYIVVDLPPLAPVVDVRATFHLIDAYVLLIEWGRTKIEVVQRALANAQDVRENILGVVLNKVDMDTIGRYDKYTGNYSREYGAKYYRQDSPVS